MEIKPIKKDIIKSSDKVFNLLDCISKNGNELEIILNVKLFIKLSVRCGYNLD